MDKESRRNVHEGWWEWGREGSGQGGNGQKAFTHIMADGCLYRFALHLVLLLFLCLVCQAGEGRRLLSLAQRLSPLVAQKAERQK